ncbi:MAG: TonB family protein [Bacteroidales bacterium]|nr:TonB family protein [Bacteroidales bacterium]
MMSCKNSSRLAIIKIMIPIAVSALLTAKFAESNAQTIFITSSKDNQINLEKQIADKDPLVMVDGQKSSMENVNTSSVKSITVLKNKPAIDAYGEQGSNGVIEITTKDADESQEQTSENNTPESEEGKIIIQSHVDPPSSPLVIIDGKEGTMDDVDASNVKSMTILKDQAALDQYGAKGANGVVVVTTKNNKKSDKPEKLKAAIPTSALDTVLTPDVMPEFPGGDRAFFEYIQNNVNYPEEAKSKGIEGTTYLKYIVNKEGKITNISIVKSSGNDLLDQEAIKVIQAAPDFKPGLKDNKPVDVPVAVPIRFGKSKK